MVLHKGYKPIHRAVAENHAEDVLRMLARKIELDARTDTGQTPLHVAVEHRHLRMVHLLLGHRADPNARDRHGRTALHIAAHAGQTDIMSDLLSMPGCDAAVRDADGITPLHLAAGEAHLAVIAQLLAHPTVLEAKSRNGRTPLHAAIAQERAEAAVLLLEHDIDVKSGDDAGVTPLHLAVKAGMIDITTRLLARKVDVNARDQSGRTPLHEAAQHEQLQLATLLLQHGANPLVKDVLGRTPYVLACLGKHRDMAALLQQHEQHAAAHTPASPPPHAHPQETDHNGPAHSHADQQSRVFTEILNAIPDLLLIVDRRFRFTFINRSAAHALRISPTECIGKTWQDIGLREDALQPLMDLCKYVFVAHESTRRDLLWHLDDGMCYFDFQVSPIHRTDGAISTVLCVARELAAPATPMRTGMQKPIKA